VKQATLIFGQTSFATCKKILMEILVEVGLHARGPVALKDLKLFQKTEMCKQNIYCLCNVKAT